MKKFIFSLAAFAAMATACQVEDINEPATPAGETFTITADIAATKTSLTVGEDGYKVDWEADDALSVVAKYADGSYAGYEFTKGEGNTFSGEVNNAANIEEIYVLYPYDSYQKSINEQFGTLNGNIGIGEKLSQSGVDNTEHIDGNLYGYSTVTEGTAKVDMKHATTLFEIILTNNSGADMEIANISLSDNKGSKLTGKFYINPVSGELQAANSAISSASLATVNATLENGVTRKFYISTAPFELAADENITINVTASDGATASVVKTIPDAEHGKFVAGTVNHINVTLDEVQEAEKIEPGEYLIAAKTTNGYWSVMTSTTGSNCFEAENVQTVTVPVSEIQCSDFYNVAYVDSYVWTISEVEGGYAIHNSNGYIMIEDSNAKYSDTSVALRIEKNDDGTYYIKQSVNSNRSLNYNYNSGSSRFKPYNISDSQYPAPVLIPWEENTAPSIIVIGDASKTVNYVEESVTFEYTTNNIDGEISITKTSDPDNIISSFSSDNGVISVILIPNTEVKEKEAVITLSYTGTESVVLTIRQDAAPAADAKYYVRITESQSDWSGQYLIVNEEKSVVLNGSLEKIDAAGNYVEVSIIDNAILSTSEIDGLSFTIDPITDGYSVKSASGYYIYNILSGEPKNALKSSKTDTGLNTISLNSDGSCKITSGSTNLQFYIQGETSRFRYYKTSQQPIHLYKLQQN